MISSNSNSIPKEDVGFPRLLYSDLRCSQAYGQYSQVIPGLLLVLLGLSPALPAALMVVTWPLMSTQIFRQCSQVHLKAAALVQYTLGFDYHGILVWQLPDTPGDNNSSCWCIAIITIAIIDFNVERNVHTYTYNRLEASSRFRWKIGIGEILSQRCNYPLFRQNLRLQLSTSWP